MANFNFEGFFFHTPKKLMQRHIMKLRNHSVEIMEIYSHFSCSCKSLFLFEETSIVESKFFNFPHFGNITYESRYFKKFPEMTIFQLLRWHNVTIFSKSESKLYLYETLISFFFPLCIGSCFFFLQKHNSYFSIFRYDVQKYHFDWIQWKSILNTHICTYVRKHASCITFTEILFKYVCI